MTKPIIFDGVIHREMSDEEQANYNHVIADAAAQMAALEAAVAAKISARTKLAALGLTDAEITALLGA